jgi:hypothetical protein
MRKIMEKEFRFEELICPFCKQPTAYIDTFWFDVRCIKCGIIFPEIPDQGDPVWDVLEETI